MIPTALKKYGLKEKEIKVYLACLELDYGSASKIANRAETSRVLTYEILKRLSELGLVSVIENQNVKCFRAADPNKFLSILSEKELAIRSVMPLLNAIKTTKSKKRPQVFVHNGKAGLKTVIDDVLESKPKELLIQGGAGLGLKLLPSYINGFHRERARRGINLRILLGTVSWGKDRAKAFTDMDRTQLRMLSKRHVSPVSTYIYENKVAFMFWMEEMPMAILIENKILQEVYRNHFDAVWNTAKIKK